MDRAIPSSGQAYRIGEAAQRSGVSADNSYRLYRDPDIHTLRFIRMCRAMDMSLEEVRTLLTLDLRDKRDCTTARGALDEHLGHVRARMAELRTLEGQLVTLRDRCDGCDTHCHTIEALHAQADALQDGEHGSAARRHV